MNWKIAALICTGIAVLASLLWSPGSELTREQSPGAKSLESALNPPPEIRKMLAKACYDCHSNRTELPWYAHLRPIREKIQQDIEAGRSAVNFSEWSREAGGDPEWQYRTLQSGCSMMQAGMMPPSYYAATHGDKPTKREIQAYCDWTRRFGLSVTIPNKQ